MPAIALVAAGPRLGRSLARLFGGRGFDVALIARDAGRLDGLAAELAADGVKAAGFTADVLDPDGLTAALERAATRFGGIDVLHYSATLAPVAGDRYTAAPDVTVENLRPQLESICYGAVAATRAVLPGMRAAGAGTLLYTTGASSVTPVAMFGSAGAAGAALRNWVLNLNGALAGEGVYAGHVAIGVWIGDTPGPAGAARREPDDIAGVYWDMHTARGPAESVVTA